jgi:hypothetical protein
MLYSLRIIGLLCLEFLFKPHRLRMQIADHLYRLRLLCRLRLLLHPSRLALFG